jgi:hypothetical protein
VNLEQRLDAFLASGGRNTWLMYRGMEVYVRVSTRLLARVRREGVIDLASASNRENRRGKGDYARFVDHCMTLGRPLFAENVINDALVEFYKRRGFKRQGRGTPPCFYWIPPKERK